MTVLEKIIRNELKKAIKKDWKMFLKKYGTYKPAKK